MAMRRRRRHKRWVGALPRLGLGLWTAARWIIRHPQPAMLAVAIGGALWMLWSYVRRADAFQIAQVSLPANSALVLPESLIGHNLWAVDLQALSEQLQRQQPSFKAVRVIRQLPNTLRVDAIPRIPVAQVHLDRWYPVDREGFILTAAGAEPARRLVRLAGVDRTPGALKIGKPNADERLQLGLRVLARLQRAPALVSRRLVEINVADPRQVKFILEGETEVRCGSEAELETHLSRLQAALRALARRQELAVQYIDVRFQEPVVGPRT